MLRMRANRKWTLRLDWGFFFLFEIEEKKMKKERAENVQRLMSAAVKDG